MKYLFTFIVWLLPVLYSCRSTSHDSKAESQSSSLSGSLLAELSPERLGLDIAAYFNQASGKIAGAVIKYFYDQPSLIQNAGLDFHADLALATDDGISLQISYYLPDEYDKGAKFPAVIFVNPWGSSANANQLSRLPQRLVKRGYIVLLLSARGFGKSGGQAAFGAERDQKDVTLAIDWLLAHTKTDVANIGITGISYGGGVGLMSLLHDPRLKTIVGMNTWVDMLDGGFYAGGGVNERAGRFLISFGRLMHCRIDQAVTMRQKMLDPAQKPQVAAWGRERSATYFLDAYNQRGAPIFFIHTYTDSFFKGNANLAFYNAYTGPKKVSFYLGVHGTNMMFEGYSSQGSSEEAAEWFDYWLKGVRDKDIQLGAVHFAIRNQKPAGNSAPAERQAAYFPDWSDEKFSHQTYYLGHQNGSFSLSTAPKAAPGTVALTTEPKLAMFGGDEDGDLIMEGLFGWPVVQDLSALNRSHAAVYFSDPLAATRIRSISRLHLAIRSSSPNPQLIAYLFDQAQQGKAQLITQGSVEVTAFTSGQAMADIEFTAIAYNLSAGHRIALVIDTRDWDFYAPPGQNNDFTILEGSSSTLSLGVE